ncbi:sulfate reduction electron transfer complex DsrMKJOP subunit DsrP [Pseudodesulfovibrio sediminis]|uniref:Hdr menaquinol oxidoreductase integral membrane subunit n=1 Tax=Pseudodesulfovibrio sediminis TaxID=2810563 RepID=A0ABM7P8T1_9BACT|nr:NrfD/PsrC family molybdoenzyme membrane anchor subunit [Pseudodesulfovibrio sediminis]BCS89440.1 Hdr menaquinol oxidoreductase integral membrane subunit [Pseudodesulfovibrio sediminis]
MLELALKGSKRYYGWIAFLLVLIGIGSTAYINQLMKGLEVTGMSRDVSWGFYISQFTYLVGLAASGVMIVLPNYFHNYKTNKHMVIFGEFMAIAACIMCLLFIIVDIGQPTRALNMVLHPTPNSILFWDMIVLNGYLGLNLLVGWTCLTADRAGLPHPKWLKPFIYTSIIWAFSIHTVTAFLYQGLPGRHYWLTAILAARFLASAFCSGPAILLLVMMVTEKFTSFKMNKNALTTLVKIIAYAMCVNMFFFALEIFTSFYSNIPGHMHPILYLFEHANGGLVTLMWTFIAFAAISITLLATPRFRNNLKLLPFTLVILVIATWIDKGLGLLIGGFNPTPFETITSYWPTGNELMISMMIYAIGALIVTVLFKIATDVKQEVGHSQALTCGCSSDDACDCTCEEEAEDAPAEA